MPSNISVASRSQALATLSLNALPDHYHNNPIQTFKRLKGASNFHTHNLDRTTLETHFPLLSPSDDHALNNYDLNTEVASSPPISRNATSQPARPTDSSLAPCLAFLDNQARLAVAPRYHIISIPNWKPNTHSSNGTISDGATT